VPLSRIVAASNEAKEELQEVVTFFEANRKRLPHLRQRSQRRGLLGKARPGTAKTRLAKRDSWRGGVPFFRWQARSSSKMFVGCGRSACRSVQARQGKKPLAFHFHDLRSRCGWPVTRRRDPRPA